MTRSSPCLKICASAPALKPLIGRLIYRRKIIVDEIKKKNIGESHSSGSATLREPFTEAQLFSYNAYWKDVDIEGIGLDGFGYTVTITAGPNLEKRKVNRLRKTVQSDDLEVGDKKNLAIGLPKAAFLKRFSIGTRSSWGSWGLTSRASSVATPKPHIEIKTRQSLEVIEEVAQESQRPISGSSFYESDNQSRHISVPFPQVQNTRSFYLESDREE
jgi:hypothetical protein